MRSGGGKQKGSSYEREVGYKLSLWISHGKRRDLLCRTVGSGAQFTFAKTRNQIAGIPGDLRSQDPAADEFARRFVVECKHWKSLDMIRFLSGEGELYKALKKVQKEGEDLQKSFMLVAKQNHRPELLFMSAGEHFAENVKYVRVLAALDGTSFVAHRLFNENVAMYFLDDFLLNVTPEMLLEKTELYE